MNSTASYPSTPATADGNVDKNGGEISGAPQVGAEDYVDYRLMSSSAVVSAIVGVVSLAALLDFWILKIIPVLGICAGLTALLRIRANPRDLTGRIPALIGIGLSAAMLVLGSALSVYGYVTELPDGYQRISYNQLKSPEGDKVIPPSARELHDKQVFIKGFMFPTDQEYVTKFLLCRDNGDCCFGGQPPLSERILVQLRKPLHTKFTGSIRHVAGTLKVAKSSEVDPKTGVLYLLDADYIK